MYPCKSSIWQVLSCLFFLFILSLSRPCFGGDSATVLSPHHTDSSLSEKRSSYDAIKNGLIGRNPSRRIQVTAADRAWLDSLGPIRLGVDAHLTPLEFIDDNKRYSGMSSAYMGYFFKQLGLHMAPVERMNWSEVMERIRNKQVDLIPMIVATPSRRRYLNFSQPYINFPQVIFTHKSRPYISGLEDLAGETLVLEKGYVTVENIHRDYPQLDIIEVPTTLAALNAVSFGHADAYVGSLLVGSYIIDHEGLTNIKVAAPTSYRIQLSIGVRKDWPRMAHLLNRVVDSLTEADHAAIRHDWLTVRYDKRTDYSLVRKVLGVAALAFMLVLFRNRELLRRKEQLEASEKQFKMLINTLPIALLIVDYKGNIIFDNSQAGRELGNNQSLVGRNSEEFYANLDDRVGILALIAENEQVLNKHVKFRIDSGKLIDCLLSVLPIRFDDQDVLLAVTVNVTHRVKMEEALAQAKKHAEEADHLKSAFLASMSHELRTPLNSIIGFTGILLQKLAGPLNDEQNKQLSMVRGSARHLLALINDVLDISKIEAGELELHPEEYNFRESLEKIVQTMKPLAGEKGLVLSCDIGPGIDRICSDRRRIEQILLNLIANGIKFTETGSVRILCRSDAPFIRIEVRDTGPGIKPHDMDKLFRTFQQIDSGLNRRYEGTGLGLSISRKLAERLGGYIQAESTWGVGSTFIFRFPVLQPESKGGAENGTGHAT